VTFALCDGQIVNQAAKIHYIGGQVTFPILYRAAVGAAASGQHSQSPYSMFMMSPLEDVPSIAPYDIKGWLKTAIPRNIRHLVRVEPADGRKGTGAGEDYTIPLQGRHQREAAT